MLTVRVIGVLTTKIALFQQLYIQIYILTSVKFEFN